MKITKAMTAVAILLVHGVLITLLIVVGEINENRIDALEEAVVVNREIASLTALNYLADKEIGRMHGEIRPATATETLWEVAE